MSNPLLVPPPHEGPAIPYEELLENARRTLPDDLPANPTEVLLALDVDGTLLRPDGASPLVRRSIDNAMEAGIKVVIATGRGIASSRPVFAALDLPGGLSVASNGAQLLDWRRRSGDLSGSPAEYDVEVISEKRFQPEASVRLVIDAVPGVLVGVDDGSERLLVSEAFPPGELLARQDLAPMEMMLQQSTVRAVLRAPWMGRSEFSDILDSLPLEDVEYAVGWTAWADVCALGATKASGLQSLADQFQIPTNGTISIGDGTNDIEMLQWAHHGVAMGGAIPAVVEAANATTGPVDYDGAAAVIEALLERY